MEANRFKKYEEISTREWPADLGTWEKLFLANVAMHKGNAALGMPYTPIPELILDMFARIGRARAGNEAIIMYPFNYQPASFMRWDYNLSCKKFSAWAWLPFI